MEPDQFIYVIPLFVIVILLIFLFRKIYSIIDSGKFESDVRKCELQLFFLDLTVKLCILGEHERESGLDNRGQCRNW